MPRGGPTPAGAGSAGLPPRGRQPAAQRPGGKTDRRPPQPAAAGGGRRAAGTGSRPGYILNPESFKSVSPPLWPWRDWKVFRRWGHLTWPGDLILGDLDLKFSGKLLDHCSNNYAKNNLGGGVFNPRTAGGRLSAPSGFSQIAKKRRRVAPPNFP